MRQRADANVRLVREAAERQEFGDPLLDPGPRRAAEPRPQPIAGGDLGRDANVFGDGKLGKDLGDLEGSRHAARDPLVWRKRRDVAPVEQDGARGRREEAAHQIEERRLAGAVRADDGAQFAGLDGQRHILDGDEIAEPLGGGVDLEQGHAFAPARSMPSTPRGKKRTTATNTRPITDIQFSVWLET